MGRAIAAINNLIISLLNIHNIAIHAQARRRFDAGPKKAFNLTSRL